MHLRDGWAPRSVGSAEGLGALGVDAAFDVAGKGALEDSIALAGGIDRVVTIADMSAAEHGVRFDTGSGEARR